MHGRDDASSDEPDDDETGDDRGRRPLGNMSQGRRATIAVVGILVGLLLIFVGLRSFDSQQTDPGPDDTLVVPSVTAGSS